ncbi:NAD(P)/FAD-dependent oxidoreductase [Anaerovorax odorimutans]|uniref:NAD(P)/FAD-dependent oxidoreductase n=1 Tax=Anaerovorax odorimutans TaxID=109327 RepID=UPI0004004C51|nr:hypothetical protein [Anaerovorax odorimutans]
MLRIHEIKLNLNEDESYILNKIIKKLEWAKVSIDKFNIIKESVDARDKENIKRVYTVDFSIDNKGKYSSEEQLLKAAKKVKGLKLDKAPDMDYKYVGKGEEPITFKPVIVGFGPCGIFAALILSQMGYRPIVIERGKSMDERVKDVDLFWSESFLNEESNVQFGEGGAGAFSDGKLTTQIKDSRVRKVLTELVAAGGSPTILYKQKPHIGTDVLRSVVVNMRNKIIENGGEVCFESKLTDIVIKNSKVKSIIINNSEKIETNNVILAIGHSSRDTFKMLKNIGLNMEQKPFSIGVRIEHKQSLINNAQYGKNCNNSNLGAADYKLSYHCKSGRGVYTFCMCPGGYVVGAASQKCGVVTNGMSYNDRAADNANSAVLVDVKPEDFKSNDPLAGVAFQEKYERLAFELGGKTYKAPAQRLGNFLKNKRPCDNGECNNTVEPTYKPGIVWSDLGKCLPEFATESIREAIPEFAKKLKGFDSPDAVMTGVETRSSSPVRMVRDENYMSEIYGIYPAGEGAGYAGGIVSAAVDGIKIAEEIAKIYNNKFNI